MGISRAELAAILEDVAVGEDDKATQSLQGRSFNMTNTDRHKDLAAMLRAIVAQLV